VLIGGYRQRCSDHNSKRRLSDSNVARNFCVRGISVLVPNGPICPDGLIGWQARCLPQSKCCWEHFKWKLDSDMDRHRHGLRSFGLRYYMPFAVLSVCLEQRMGGPATWLAQASLLLPSGTAFTFQWGFTLANGMATPIGPVVAQPWASQQANINKGQGVQ
jgi:hypothetical protein